MPFAWVCWERRALGGAAGWRRLIGVRALHLTAALIFALNFSLCRIRADVSDYCAPLSGDAAACVAWPALPVADCAAVQDQTRYRCEFVSQTLSEDEVRLFSFCLNPHGEHASRRAQ